MASVVLSEGTKYELATNANYAIEQYALEGERIEVKLTFDSRFSGFENAAIILENNLRSGEENGEKMNPWPGNYQIVYVDPQQPIYYIRYLKGVSFMLLLTICLIAIAVIWTQITKYQALKYGLPPNIADSIKLIGTVVAIAAVGFVISAIGTTVEKTRRTETKIEYGRGIKPV